MKWIYGTQNVPGNAHDAVSYLNDVHPEWDVVAMHFVTGHSTVIVYRVPNEEKKKVDEFDTALVQARVREALDLYGLRWHRIDGGGEFVKAKNVKRNMGKSATLCVSELLQELSSSGGIA